MTPTFEGDTTALFAALAKAQAQMGGAKKGKANPFFKSRYADLASVLEVALPALTAHGLSLMQLPGFDAENGLPTLTTILAHEGGGRISSTASIPASKLDPQGYGSAITYLRRYAAQAALAIPSVDDDGEGAHGRGGSPKNPPKPRAKAKAPAKPKASQAPSQAEEDRGHDPSWSADQKVFFFSIDELGWSYDELKFICASMTKPRPSQMMHDQRKNFVQWLAQMSTEQREGWKREYQVAVGGAPSPQEKEIF